MKQKQKNTTSVTYIGEQVFARAKALEAIRQIRKENGENLLDPNTNVVIAQNINYLECIIPNWIPDADVIQFRIDVPITFFPTEEHCIKWNKEMDKLAKASGQDFTKWKVTLIKEKENPESLRGE